MRIFNRSLCIVTLYAHREDALDKEGPMASYVMAFDAGTTSNRCILFDHGGQVLSVSQKEFRQYYPKPGWVEHDAEEIWHTMLSATDEAMKKLNACAEDIAAIGITNQRETVIVWDRATGKPVCPAIVW